MEENEVKKTIESVTEEDSGSQLEKDVKKEKLHTEEQIAYQDPITEEYKRDMCNWLGINTRKRRDEK